jgi:branched-chain amino acid transport system ATP-binding protein
VSLQIAGITRSFGGVKAVQDVSIDIEPGQIVGLIGPNGAGKSTVVNLVTGVLRLDAGHVRIDGRDVSSYTMVDVSRAGVSRTFQNIRLLNDSTVLENVSLGLARHARTSMMACLLGLRSARAEQLAMHEGAMRVLEDVGLTRYAQLEAAGLSYGHQRRVEIARAIATQPSYVLLDEPVAGMNDVEAQELAGLLRRLTDKGIGILLIEHNMRFVQALCSRVYVLNTGSMLAHGTPAEVSTNPAVIAAYLGA